MTTEGWIFMVGLRVVDIGALVVWLVWFYRQSDNDEGDDFRWDDDVDEPPTAPEPRGDGPMLDLPLPDAEPWPRRRRDHTGNRPGSTQPARHVPAHRPAPARVTAPVD